MPIFESLRQKEEIPCSYPLAMGTRSSGPTYHWINRTHYHEASFEIIMCTSDSYTWCLSISLFYFSWDFCYVCLFVCFSLFLLSFLFSLVCFPLPFLKRHSLSWSVCSMVYVVFLLLCTVPTLPFRNSFWVRWHMNSFHKYSLLCASACDKKPNLLFE